MSVTIQHRLHISLIALVIAYGLRKPLNCRHNIIDPFISCDRAQFTIEQRDPMFAAGPCRGRPVAQEFGIRNLYFGSAALLGSVGVVGYRKLHGQKPAAATAQA